MEQLAAILSSGVRAEVFRLLFGVGSAELPMREIERRSALSIGAVQRELRKLLRLELVESRRAGNRGLDTSGDSPVSWEPLDLGEAGESRVHLRGVLPGA